MGYKSKTTIYEVVPLSAGYEATIQVYRSEAADLIESAMLRGAQTMRRRTVADAGGTAHTEAEQDLDNNALLRETLLQGIARWTLDEDDGTVWPIDVAHLKELTAADRMTLFRAIGTLNSPLDPNANSSGASTSS